MRRFLKIWKKKFRFRKKQIRLQNGYQNWTLVSVSDTKTWFRSHNKPYSDLSQVSLSVFIEKSNQRVCLASDAQQSPLWSLLWPSQQLLDCSSEPTQKGKRQSKVICIPSNIKTQRNLIYFCLWIDWALMAMQFWNVCNFAKGGSVGERLYEKNLTLQHIWFFSRSLFVYLLKNCFSQFLSNWKSVERGTELFEAYYSQFWRENSNLLYCEAFCKVFLPRSHL